MRLIGFDLETTGVDPTQDRPVSYALVPINANGTAHGTRSSIINPGVPIPEESTKIHGITTERAAAEGITPSAALDTIMRAFQFAINANAPICGYNIRFDLTMIAYELARQNRHADIEILDSIFVVDPLVLDKHYDKYRPGKRTLEVTCAHYGVELKDAHNAMADALAAGHLFQALAKRYVTIRETPIDELHKTQVAWAKEQAQSLQQYFRRTDPKATVETRWPYAFDAQEVPA